MNLIQLQIIRMIYGVRGDLKLGVPVIQTENWFEPVWIGEQKSASDFAEINLNSN